MLYLALIVIVIFVLLACSAGSAGGGIGESGEKFVKLDEETKRNLRDDINLRIHYEQEAKIDKEAREELTEERYQMWRAQKNSRTELPWQSFIDDGRGDW
ncbi:MAG TPA: hypothetical protein VJC05_04495 [Candidatus Andersenbacteria bacterium]|nr:hypothetical protein [Candidatus Andersenbacteria bacterium]